MRGLARNFAFGLAEKYLQTGLALASSIILARMLSPAEIGVYSIAAVLTGLVQVFRDLGTGQLLVARPELSMGEQRALLSISLGMGWTLAVLMALLAEPMAAFYRQPELSKMLRILALNFVLVPFSSQATALLRREMRAAALFRIANNGVLAPRRSAFRHAWQVPVIAEHPALFPIRPMAAGRRLSRRHSGALASPPRRRTLRRRPCRPPTRASRPL